VAAPFTSRVPSVRAVVDLIRQGRLAGFIFLKEKFNVIYFIDKMYVCMYVCMQVHVVIVFDAAADYDVGVYHHG
jgi:hypothetical protein